nr:TRAP transporter large permease subunit [Thermotoga sp. Cell2]
MKAKIISRLLVFIALFSLLGIDIAFLLNLPIVSNLQHNSAGTILLLSNFFLTLMIGVPISLSLGFSALITAFYLKVPAMIIFQKISAGINSFSLTAIPFFILAGQIMSEGGIASQIVEFSKLIVGRIRGGLAMVNIVASMFFGGVSGSSVADVSSIGAILIPAMEKEGYDREFSVAVTVTSSTQGIIIPPSHNMIIYSLAAGGVSIGALFMAGYIPGIMVGIAQMIVAYIIARKKIILGQRKYP